MKITEKDFGQGYHLITLENKNKLALSISDLGARIVSLKSNDRELVLDLTPLKNISKKIRISVLLSVAPQGESKMAAFLSMEKLTN